MPNGDDIRRTVRRSKKKPPPTSRPPETRERRLLRQFAQAMETPRASGPLSKKQRAWYRGTVRGFLTALQRGAFRRNWKADRDLVRSVQIACAVWIEGTSDELPG